MQGRESLPEIFSCVVEEKGILGQEKSIAETWRGELHGPYRKVGER